MSLLMTLLLGAFGGALAFSINLPVPWLVGSLIAMVVCKKLPFLVSPSKLLSRWMRVVLGVALGASVAQSLQAFSLSIVTLFVIVLAFVSLISLAGYYYFRNFTSFSNADSFMSSLPGGLTFLMSLSDNLGEKFPKIALIHTVRMVFLIFCFSFLAFVIGTDNASHATMQSAFSISADIQLWQVLVFAFVMGLVSDRLNIAGGHIMFPMIAAAIFYSQGWMTVPVPEILPTLAMITFGVTIGCKLNTVSFSTFGPYIHASLVFTIFAMLVAFLLSLVLGDVLDMHYFLIFLALAPGSIAEISLIALALGFDVGIVALMHTCRYLFIMFIGSMGLKFLTRQKDAELSQVLPNSIESLQK